VRAQHEDAKPGTIGQLLWRRRRVTHDDGLGTFVVRQDGRYVLTMMGACVLTSVALDVQYALDSAVVAVAVSKTTFVLVTANVLAAFAIRGGYFVVQRMQYPAAAHTVNVALFAFGGLKLLVLAHAPPLLVLGVSLALVGAGVVAIAVRVLSD
jgi:tellurite resistance protein TerC